MGSILPFQKDLDMFFAEYAHWNYSILTGNYQMKFNNLKSPLFQLFDIKSDPYGKNNIAKGNENITKQLFLKHKEVYSNVPIYETTTTIILDEQTREQLKALGYIDPDNGLEQPSKYADNFDCDGIPNGNCP